MAENRPVLRGNLLDRIVTYVSPRHGLSRLQSRMRLGISGAYTGASHDDKAMREFKARLGSADADSLADLPTLRARSRDLVRNNPIAAGAVKTNIRNTIGTGLVPRPQPDAELLGLTDEEAAAWAREAERIFWAHAARIDLERKQPFWEMQSLVLQSELESGDLFAVRRFVAYPGDVLGLKVQLIEADRVCNPNYRYDTETLRDGVEMDRNGVPLRYHVLNRHPGDAFYYGADRWSPVPAFSSRDGSRITLHLYRRTRPGQTRGIPYLAPVIASLKQLGRYHDAEVYAAVVGGMVTGVITSDSADDAPPAFTGGPVTDPTQEGGTEAADLAKERGEIEMDYGAVFALDKGEDIKFNNPNRPNTAFDAFVIAFCRYIGSALEIPFELLVLHFTASYSAARAALLEAWKHFSTQRDHVAYGFCQPVYEWIITEAVARRLIAAPGFFRNPFVRQAWLQCGWRGPSQGQIDPLKEVNAAKERVAFTLSTLADETATLTGGDFEQNVKQRGREVKLLKEYGLDVEPIAERIQTETTQKDGDAEEREERAEP